jgi:hypothetical protein
MADACNEPQADDAAWVAHWQRIGPLLERIRREELRNFKYEDHIDLIDSLLEIGCRMGPPRTTSGLVEMQRLFQKARQQEESEE